MTTNEQIAELIDLTKSGKTRTYAEAVEALKTYQDDIDRRQARVDERYARGKGDAGLTKVMEQDVAKMRYAMEQMKVFVSYLFDANERDLDEDLVK